MYFLDMHVRQKCFPVLDIPDQPADVCFPVRFFEDAESIPVIQQMHHHFVHDRPENRRSTRSLLKFGSFKLTCLVCRITFASSGCVSFLRLISVTDSLCTTRVVSGL